MSKEIVSNLKRIPKIKLPSFARMIIFLIFVILILYSFSNIYSAYEKPLTTTNTITTASYLQLGIFDYVINLQNNTVYNKSTILPGEGQIFTNILEDINASFSYSFSINVPTNINVNYYLKAEIQTDLWQKTYTLIPSKEFNYSGKNYNFKENFTLNYSFYNDIVLAINEETGIIAKEPTLVITCPLNVYGNNEKGYISKSISPSFSLTLNKKIIEISDSLMSQDSGSFRDTITEYHPELLSERNSSLTISIIMILLTGAFVFFTKSIKDTKDKFKILMKKIERKYGEWIVETKKPNPSIKRDIISLNSLDDIQKISEELGKPILHFNSKNSNQHEYYILDDDISYQFILKPEEKIRKIAICPQCKHEIPIEGYPGSNIQIECNKCGKKGVIFLGEDGQKKSFSDYFNKLFKRNF